MSSVKRKPEFWFVMFLLVIAYFVFVVWKDLRDLGDLDRDKTGLLNSLEKENVFRKELEEQVQSLNSHGQMELLARHRLGMIKKGETPFKIINIK